MKRFIERLMAPRPPRHVACQCGSTWFDAKVQMTPATKRLLSHPVSFGYLYCAECGTAFSGFDTK